MIDGPKTHQESVQKPPEQCTDDNRCLVQDIAADVIGDPSLPYTTPEQTEGLRRVIIENSLPLVGCVGCPLRTSGLFSGTTSESRSNSETPTVSEVRRNAVSAVTDTLYGNKTQPSYYALTYGSHGRGGYNLTGVLGSIRTDWGFDEASTVLPLTSPRRKPLPSLVGEIEDPASSVFNGNRGVRWEERGLIPDLGVNEAVVIKHEGHMPSILTQAGYTDAITLAYKHREGASRGYQIFTFSLLFNDRYTPQPGATKDNILADPQLMIELFKKLFPEGYGNEDIRLFDEEIRVIKHSPPPKPVAIPEKKRWPFSR